MRGDPDFFMVLPVDSFLLCFGMKTIWYLHSHVVCAIFCSFAILKHLFGCGRELEQLRLIEKVFFMFNFLVPTGIACRCLFRLLAPQRRKGNRNKATF